MDLIGATGLGGIGATAFFTTGCILVVVTAIGLAGAGAGLLVGLVAGLLFEMMDLMRSAVCFCLYTTSFFFDC